MQQITRDLMPVTHGICSFVQPQQNCEKPIRAIFILCRSRPAKAGHKDAGLDQIGSSRHG